MFKKMFISKVFLIFFYLFFFQLNGKNNTHSIVLVHIGDDIPAYLSTCLKQIRFFNTCDVYLISNKSALGKFESELASYSVKGIACESLQKSVAHKSFIDSKRLTAGFWSYATERFFYLDELMRSHNLQNVFHMEYDNMLYVDLATLLDHFENNYAGIAATFDNDNRCIPGFMYIKNGKCSASLARFLSRSTLSSKNDMESIALYGQAKGIERIDFLPIVCSEYSLSHRLISTHGHVGKEPDNYSKNIHFFDSIFDAAAIGQYLGGIDPRNGVSKPGFINESCVFNPSLFSYEWRLDSSGHKVPYMVYAERAYRINNLHIHSKKLYEFLS